MDLFTTLDEAIHVAKETWLAEYPEMDTGSSEPAQFSMQKYVMQDGDIMWSAEFAAQTSASLTGLPLFFDDAALAVWQGDYDSDELEAEWSEENTLHEWDEGEFQLTPPLDSEEGRAAAEEWTDDDSEVERW